MQTVTKETFHHIADSIRDTGRSPILIEIGFNHYLGYADTNGVKRAYERIATPRSWETRVRLRERFEKWLSAANSTSAKKVRT